MDAKDVVSLAIAMWGAFLATYQWWASRRHQRITLKVWNYWSATFVGRLQNVSSKPMQIAEISLRGRFLSEPLQRMFRIKDEEFQIVYPHATDESPLILQPQESHTQSFDGCWDALDRYEIARLRDRADGGPERLPIKALVLHIVDGEERTHKSKPYVLAKQPSPRHSEEGYVFVAPIRLPTAFGLRAAPKPLRIVSALLGRLRRNTTKHQPMAAIDAEELEAILTGNDDAAVCNTMCDKICQRTGFEINRVASHERLVVVVCTALRIIASRGLGHFFAQNFPGVRDYSDFPLAFRAIGSEEAAASLEQALRLFPKGAPQHDLEQRRSHVEGELTAKLEQLEGAIRGNTALHFKRLAAYIRTNRLLFTRPVQSAA